MNKTYKRLENLIIFEDGTIYREFKKCCKLVVGTPHYKGYLNIKCHGKIMKKHRLIMEAFNGKSDFVHYQKTKEKSFVE